MKKIINILVVIAVVSLITAIISRITLIAVPPLALKDGSLLNFADTCLLLAIALTLLKCKGKE